MPRCCLLNWFASQPMTIRYSLLSPGRLKEAPDVMCPYPRSSLQANRREQHDCEMLEKLCVAMMDQEKGNPGAFTLLRCVI